MSEIENIEERIEYWVGELEAIDRSFESLEARRQEIEESLGELTDLADAAESSSEWAENAWDGLVEDEE